MERKLRGIWLAMIGLWSGILAIGVGGLFYVSGAGGLGAGAAAGTAFSTSILLGIQARRFMDD
jgi:hypothetical protein